MNLRLLLLEQEWDQNKNVKKLSNYTKGSHFKAWWTHMCTCGEKHEWQQVIKQRILSNNDCPYCSKIPKKLCKCRSLAYLCPEIAKEWHPTKNKETPSEVFARSNIKVWWLCGKNRCSHKHEWQARIAERSGGQGCPYCCHNSLTVCACYSLFTKFPAIAKEWHPTKNKELEITGLSIFTLPAKSGRKVWWLCSKGHEWESRIADRVRTDFRQLSCTLCNGTTSFGERKITELLETLKIAYIPQRAINADGIILKFDFYLPDYNKAIEFDGDLHFRVTKFFGGREKYERTIEMDTLKNQYCANHGIHLLRIYWKDVDDSKIILEDFLNNDLGKVWYTKNYPI